VDFYRELRRSSGLTLSSVETYVYTEQREFLAACVPKTQGKVTLRHVFKLKKGVGATSRQCERSEDLAATDAPILCRDKHKIADGP